ncbi:right-handed parallel beta-helix repeat-containing protein [Treponema denticola]|uniref:right-handed parallel beta-helix repeat-containing protein n=1 Tax=Treponema denticola TaxID=158 RepID=UPI0021F84C3F|nr:right-handed parallel beta-helix repeat-containing protein [Treponema denticola]UYT08438.1 right-handed parallel beta-helix repeat-containing protein [Treponema denticola]
MKKLLKILTTIAAVLAAALFFAGCKQFLEDPEEFLGYWSSEVVPIDFSINKPYQMSNDGALCIPSADDVKLKIKLRNPRNFTLIMPTSVLDAGKVINFPGFPSDQQPRYDTDYTFKQTGDMLELTYTKAFLKAHEWSNGGIGPEITLISTDGRKFGKKFSLNIEANTPPPEIGDITIAKTEGYYALCFNETEGMTPILNGKRLHKDIKAIHIQKEGGSEGTIPLTVKEDGSGFYIPSTLPEGLLSSVDTIFDPPPAYGSWTVYIKTNTELAASDALPKKYTVRLIDEKGLSSAPKEAKTLGSIPDISDNTKAWKNLKRAVESAEAGGVITVMNNVIATIDPDNSGAIDVTRSLTIKSKNGAELDANQSALGSNANRIFTVTGDKTEFTLENLTLKNGYANPGGLFDYRYGGAISASQIKTLTLKNCVIEDCKAYGGGGISLNGGVEAVLESCTITGCQTTAGGGGAIYAGDSSGKQPVVRIKGGLIKNNTGYVSGGAINISRGSLYIEKYENDNARIENNTVIASGGGGNGGGGISYYWDADKPGKLTIENAEITNCNIEYNSSGDKNAHGAGISVYGNGDVSLSNVTLNRCEFTGESLGNEFGQKQGGGIYLRKVSTANIKGCTIKGTANITANEGGGIYAVDSNLTIEDTEIQNNKAQKKGGGLYVLAAYADVNLTIKGTTQFDGNDVNLTSGDPWGGGIYMKGNSPKSVTAVMTGGEVLLNEAYDGGGIYIDSNASFTMTGGLLTGNDADIGSGGKGKGVYLAAGGTFTMSGSAKIKDTDDVYLSNGTMITLSGRLSEYPAACITPENYEPSPGVFAQVLTGDITAGSPPNYLRFKVTPKDLGSGNMQEWEVDENGYLKN